MDLPEKGNSSHLVPQLVLMPLVDLADHHLPLPESPLSTEDDLQAYQEAGARTRVSFDGEASAVVLKATAAFGPATSAEVTVGYGVRSNADYLLYHGFAMSQAWSDALVCILHSSVELPLPEGLPPWKSQFLEHPFRFLVPACPSRKSKPDLVLGAARFLVATEADLASFQERGASDPSLSAEAAPAREDKFLQQGARKALSTLCDVTAAPPVCRLPLSLDSERRAWALIRNRTVARVAAHVNSVDDDDRLLRQDDASGDLTVNQRHAVIVRREEKLGLQRWCSLVVMVSDFLDQPEGERALELVRVSDGEALETDEPRARPAYWARLSEPPPLGASLPADCRAGRAGR